MEGNNRCLNDNDKHMKKLSAKGVKWLNGFHLIAVSSWIGGAVSLLALYFLKRGCYRRQRLVRNKPEHSSC